MITTRTTSPTATVAIFEKDIKSRSRNRKRSPLVLKEGKAQSLQSKQLILMYKERKRKAEEGLFLWRNLKLE